MRLLSARLGPVDWPPGQPETNWQRNSSFIKLKKNRHTRQRANPLLTALSCIPARFFPKDRCGKKD